MGYGTNTFMNADSAAMQSSSASIEEAERSNSLNNELAHLFNSPVRFPPSMPQIGSGIMGRKLCQKETCQPSQDQKGWNVHLLVLMSFRRRFTLCHTAATHEQQELGPG